MTLGEIKQEIINSGQNPDDFNIEISQNCYKIMPKWFYEQKQIAKKEDENLKKQVDLETAQNAMEILGALSAIEVDNEVKQATMLMEILSMIEALQGGGN